MNEPCRLIFEHSSEWISGGRIPSLVSSWDPLDVLDKVHFVQELLDLPQYS